MQYEYHGDGHDVITYGDQGDKFYLIIQGSVSIHVPKAPRKSTQESDDKTPNQTAGLTPSQTFTAGAHP